MGSEKNTGTAEGSGEEEWIKRCKAVYETALVGLIENHPGECAAIDGERVLEVGNYEELAEKYRDPNLPRVTFFYIPLRETALSLKLRIPTGPRFRRIDYG